LLSINDQEPVADYFNRMKSCKEEISDQQQVVDKILKTLALHFDHVVADEESKDLDSMSTEELQNSPL